MDRFCDVAVGALFTRFSLRGTRYRRVESAEVVIDGTAYPYNAVAVDYAGRPIPNGEAEFLPDFEVVKVGSEGV